MHFHGNLPYCYANCVAMVASTQGEQIYPGLVEVLTGVGLGARRVDGGPTFFSTTPQQVPYGINKALDLLGFTFTARSGGDGPAEKLLRDELETGPVILGPLDMGHLTYVPWHEHAAGSDHYVVAYGADHHGVRLHCPAGFPATVLEWGDLDVAWQATRIGFPGGPWHRWTELRRVATPGVEEIRHRALDYFASLYRERTKGSAVIGELAASVRGNSVSDSERGFLTGFMLPLGARRALDYAWFFADAGHADLASCHRARADVLGRCLIAANRGEWSTVADQFDELAHLESHLEQAFGKY